MPVEVEVKITVVPTVGNETLLASRNPNRLWVAFLSNDAAAYALSNLPGQSTTVHWPAIQTSNYNWFTCALFPGLPQLEWWTSTGGGSVMVIEGLKLPN